MVILHKRRTRPIASRAALPRALEQLQDYLLQGHARKSENPPRQVRFTLCEFGDADPGMIASITHSIADLAQCASSRAKADNTYVHLVFSAAPEDGVLTEETWRELIPATLEKLRLDPGGWYAVGHGDRDHDHVHVVAGTIDPVSHRMALVHRKGSRLARLAEGLERRYGLRRTGENARTPSERARRRQYRDTARAGGEELAAQLSPLADQLRLAQSWAQLQALLAQMGVRTEKRRRSLIFCRPGGVWCRSAAVHRSLTLTAVQRRLGELPPAPSVPQPSPAPAPEPEHPQLRMSEKYDNAALRRLLTNAAADTLLTGSTRAQARAAREAAKLRLKGERLSVSFADTAVQAAFEHMLATGSVLRSGEITAFAPAPPAARTPEAAPAAAEAAARLPDARIPAETSARVSTAAAALRRSVTENLRRQRAASAEESRRETARRILLAAAQLRAAVTAATQTRVPLPQRSGTPPQTSRPVAAGSTDPPAAPEAVPELRAPSPAAAPIPDAELPPLGADELADLLTGDLNRQAREQAHLRSHLNAAAEAADPASDADLKQKQKQKQDQDRPRRRRSRP